MKSSTLFLLSFFSLFLMFYLHAQVNSNTSDGYNLHRVTQKQTLFGLSKEYNVTIDEIKSANDGLPNGLQEGMLIRVPKHKESIVAESTPVFQQKPEKQKFFEYQARGKEMIYPLAVRYQVSVDSIFVLNPGISETLKADQIIKIPVTKNTAGFITHKVKQGQPLTKLAKNYNLSVEEIKAINPYISRELHEGQIVRIPVLKMDSDNQFPVELLPAKIENAKADEPELIVSPDEFCKKVYKGESFKIALMLPFYLSQVDSVSFTTSENAGNLSKTDYLKSFTFIQFYEGFMMAVDSLKNLGLHVEIHVYNVEDDVFSTRTLLADPELKEMDLIVGPVFAKSFNTVAVFAKEHNINIVNPFSVRDEILNDNPFVFKVKPSLDYQFETLVDFLNSKHKNAEIFIVRQNQYRDESGFNKLKAVLDQKFESSSMEPYHEINYGNDSLVSFIRKASSEKQNTVIIYSENKAFILDMLRKLNEIREFYPVTVIGLPSWKKMEDIETEHVLNLNTHLLASDFINYESLAVRSFVKNFREKYNTEPQQYAFEGFDIGVYFINALMKYDKNIGNCIQNFRYDGLQSGYHFEKISGNGFSNKYWKILKVAEYRYEDVSPVLSD